MSVKSSNASLLPILLAVTAVGGMGWYVKRGNGPEPTIKRPPAVVKVETKASGPGSPADDLDLANPAAAWVSYETFLNERKQSPSTAHFRFRFVAKDEKGQAWPTRVAHTSDRSYVLVQGGLPSLPKELVVTCYNGSAKVAEWPVTTAAQPKPRLSESEVKPVPAAFAKWNVRPTLTKGAVEDTTELQFKVDQKTGDETVHVELIGHRYGLKEGREALVIPDQCLSLITLAEIELSLTKTWKLEPIVLRVPGGKVVTTKSVGGDVRKVEIDASKVETTSGLKLRLKPSGIYYAIERGQPLLPEGTKMRIEKVSSTGPETQIMVLMNEQGRSQFFAHFIVAQNQQEVPPFEVTITSSAVLSSERQRFVVPLDASKLARIERPRKPRGAPGAQWATAM